jgi:uncharacterized Zn-finger protein
MQPNLSLLSTQNKNDEADLIISSFISALEGSEVGENFEWSDCRLLSAADSQSSTAMSLDELISSIPDFNTHAFSEESDFFEQPLSLPQLPEETFGFLKVEESYLLPQINTARSKSVPFLDLSSKPISPPKTLLPKQDFPPLQGRPRAKTMNDVHSVRSLAIPALRNNREQKKEGFSTVVDRQLFFGPSRGHFHCNTCDTSFTRRHDLKRHLLRHAGIRPNKCQKCSKAFARPDALARHSSQNLCENDNIQM